MQQFPHKTFIVDIPNEDMPWDVFKSCAETMNIIFCVYDLSLIDKCKEYDLKYYWGHYIRDWYTLRTFVKNFEPEYLILAEPLIFNLDKVREYTKIPLRFMPNCANKLPVKEENGLKCFWMRPEDIVLYSKYFSAIDFKNSSLKEEATYFHIYKDNKEWKGNLNLLIKDLNLNVDNRGLPKDFGERRLNCGQRCMSNDSCHGCETAVHYSNALRNEYFRSISPTGVTVQDVINIANEVENAKRN